MLQNHFDVRVNLTVTLSVVGVKSSPVCANAYMLTQGDAPMLVLDAVVSCRVSTNLRCRRI